MYNFVFYTNETNQFNFVWNDENFGQISKLVLSYQRNPDLNFNEYDASIVLSEISRLRREKQNESNQSIHHF